MQRAAVSGAPRLRVVVLMGSGCSGMGPRASAYFQGLEDADIWVLHKPHTKPWLQRPPQDCGPDFVQYDRLSTWQADALHALWSLRAQSTPMTTWLVGISEGAEVLPALASALGDELRGVVLLSAPGLDPAASAQLQAQRMGRPDAWQEICRAAASAQADHAVLHGRSLGYWRDMLGWSLQSALLAKPWTILQVWGGADELVPSAAYEQFADAARGKPAHLCTLRLPEADHGLYSRTRGTGQPGVWKLVAGWFDFNTSCPQAPATP